VTSDNMYPGLDRDAVRKIEVPTLLLSGGKSPASHKSVDEELERLLPESSRQRLIIRDVDHGMWFQQPEACRKATLEFLRGK
jgi:pimeloyl-ACP methyl ester carboxylesterase